MSSVPTQSKDNASRFFQTDSRSEVLARLGDALDAREPFLLLIGNAGAGKTRLLHAVISRWGKRAVVAFITNPALTRNELLEEIVRRFGIGAEAGASKPQLLAALERRLTEAFATHQTPVVVIDDAHDLAPELLGELKLLANSSSSPKSLKVLLAGSPELERMLNDPALAALKQRVAVQCHAHPLNSQETRHFLQDVLCAEHGWSAGLFPRKAAGEIFRRSGGLPRVIASLAARSASLAQNANSGSVRPEDVQEAGRRLATRAHCGTRDDTESRSLASGTAGDADVQRRQDTCARGFGRAGDRTTETPARRIGRARPRVDQPFHRARRATLRRPGDVDPVP
jgi:type II secretory pathway predicted ATPase ExeA